MRKTSFSIAFLLILALTVFTSCARVGEIREESKSVPLDNAQSVDVRLRMSAGELRLEGGAPGLMEGRFRTNVERWQPRVDYRLNGTTGILDIEQPRRPGIHLGRTDNSWDVRLNDSVPIDLAATFGAGEAKVVLGTMNIKGLEIKMGVGDLTLDLAGYNQKSFRGLVKGGIGHATLYLPEKVGVRVSVDGGLGSIDAQGFMVEHHVYTNDAYGKSDVTIDLKVEAGIGSLDLRLR
jgi:hypothetical protein